MSFVEEFRHDREELKENLLSSQANVIISQEDVLNGVVLKEFNRLHECAPNADYFRVTFHSDVKGVISYNTRLNGEYNCGDPVVANVDKKIMSTAVILAEKFKHDPLEAWANGISAHESYDTDTKMAVYVFEFFG